MDKARENLLTGFSGAFDNSGVTSLDWRSYPILTFSEVLQVAIVLIDRPDLASSGAGESAAISAAAMGTPSSMRPACACGACR